MISVISSPENLTAAFLSVAFELQNSDSSGSFDVQIYNDDASEILGIKRYVDLEEYTVELSDYLRYRFDIEPNTDVICELFTDEGKLVGIRVKIDDMSLSDATYHTFATANAHVYSPMSNAPLQRKIAWNQKDELSLLVPLGTVSAIYTFSGDGDDYSIELNSVSAENKVVSLVTCMQTLSDYLDDKSLYSKLNLAVYVDGVKSFEIDYSLQDIDDDAHRLCWVNKYGALDFYTFTGEPSAVAKVTKQRIYTSEGYKISGSSMTKTTSLCSNFETQSNMEWLIELLASPMVWMDKGVEYQLVDITTSEVVYMDEDMLRLEIDIREVLNTLFQHI